jgi:glycosyltransferase involved in cell wall biosynthesis
MRILWLTNIPSPYRVDFFNELGLFHELVVLFEQKKSKERSSGWEKLGFANFEGIFLKGVSTGVDSSFCPSCIKYIRTGRFDVIFVTNFSDLTGILAIIYMKLKKIKYVIESDGGKVSKESYLKKKIKSMIISGAEKYFSTSEIHERYYLEYGAKEDDIIRFPFSSVSDKDIIHGIIPKKEKLAIRKELSLPISEKIVLSVGQFVPRKGYDLLLNAANMIDARIILIGGKVTEEYLKIIEEKKIKNVEFYEFMSKDKIMKFMRAADVFVLPTREDIWGLVINESMSQGLPTVTTKTCLSGTVLIKDRFNGFLYDYKDLRDLISKTNVLLKLEESEYNTMSQNCINTAKKFTIESMVGSHLEYLR